MQQGTWNATQVVCPALPHHLFLRYTRNNGTGDVTVFTASIPRNGDGRVRIIPIQRRGYSLFSPAPINALTISAFNHIRAEEPDDQRAANWLGNGLCYAALAGGHPRMPDPDADAGPGQARARAFCSARCGWRRRDNPVCRRSSRTAPHAVDDGVYAQGTTDQGNPHSGPALWRKAGAVDLWGDSASARAAGVERDLEARAAASALIVSACGKRDAGRVPASANAAGQQPLASLTQHDPLNRRSAARGGIAGHQRRTHLGIALGGFELAGMPVRKRCSTRSFSTPITLS